MTVRLAPDGLRPEDRLPGSVAYHKLYLDHEAGTKDYIVHMFGVKGLVGTGNVFTSLPIEPQILLFEYGAIGGHRSYAWFIAKPSPLPVGGTNYEALSKTRQDKIKDKMKRGYKPNVNRSATVERVKSVSVFKSTIGESIFSYLFHTIQTFAEDDESPLTLLGFLFRNSSSAYVAPNPVIEEIPLEDRLAVNSNWGLF